MFTAFNQLQTVMLVLLRGHPLEYVYKLITLVEYVKITDACPLYWHYTSIFRNKFEISLKICHDALTLMNSKFNLIKTELVPSNKSQRSHNSKQPSGLEN